MCDDRCREIRRRLDDGVSLASFGRDACPTEDSAARFFRDLFVQPLDFDGVPSSHNETPWQDLPVHKWPGVNGMTIPCVTAARVIARRGPFRIVYVELSTLTRTAERSAVESLARSDSSGDWGSSGTFLAIFHAPGEAVWHLVTPYDDSTEGYVANRPVLRRYVLGAGQTHRAVASELAELNATDDDFADRLHEAFRLKPLVRHFYGEYVDVFETLRDEFETKGLSEAAADRRAHLTLNRLLVCYCLQQTGWIDGRTDFIRWFLGQYEHSNEVNDEDRLHETWLTALFDELYRPHEPSDDSGSLAELPDPVAEALADLPTFGGGLFNPAIVETDDVFLSDATVKSTVREFFERYPFTVCENRPTDIDIAIGPSMLGTIYESCIAGRERGGAGIFYTPRTEVDLLCRMALFEQLCNQLGAHEPATRQRIVELVFSDLVAWNRATNESTAEVVRVLRSLDIVDPSCGGGAFLVGMTDVLTELYRKLGYSPEYDLKKRILAENISGVDVKSWAVHVAELRLLLWLLRPESPRPISNPRFSNSRLPDLSFDLLVGDALVQSDGLGEPLPFDALRDCRREATNTDSTDDGANETKRTSDVIEIVGRKRRDFAAQKARFFDGDTEDPTVVEKRKTDLVLAALDRIIDSKTNSKTVSKTDSKTDRQSTCSTAKNATCEELERIRERAESDDVTWFVWELDFPDVMLTGGFDIVIGNPPYVRHEDIFPPDVSPSRFEAMTDDAIREVKSVYKRRLEAFVERRFDRKPYRTSDLYLYFYFRSLDVLRNGGTLSFVSSNSWLDVDYGGRLRKFLLDEGDVRYLLESRACRTFTEADINTVLSVVNRQSSDDSSNAVEFVAADEGYDRFVSTGLEAVLLGSGPETSFPFANERLSLRSGDGWRSIVVPETALYAPGGTHANADTGPDKWGKYLRAPTIFFHIVGNTNREMVSLGDCCTVRRGTRTGANQFFYLPSNYYDARPEGDSLVLTATGEWPDEEYETELEIPSSYWMHETGDGWQPNYLLKTSKSFDSPILDAESLELGRGLRYVLRIANQKTDLHGDIAAYVRWGEEYDPSRDDIGCTDTPFPSSVSNRGVDWYDITEDLRRGDVLPMKNIGRRHAYWFSNRNAWIDDRLHGVEVPGGDRNRRFVAGLLNSTYGALAAEVNGRVSLGQGALDVTTDDHKRTLVPRLETVDERLKDDIAAKFEILGSRPVTSIFDELGCTDPESVSLERVAPDRLELDRLVVRDLLGFDEETHRELYRGVLDLTRQRVEKANSV